MPTFVHPLLLWGLALAALPVLIHLINLLRHRRVEWAAMEFLLISQKRRRTRVILKQLLLLMLRMAAVAAVVLIVAQPLWENQWSGVFGGMKTHHILLWDDSYSMSDRWADTSAFDQAKQVIARIGGEAARQAQPQLFTLLRFSQAGGKQRATNTDFLRERVVNDFTAKLDDALQKIHVSETDAGPVEPLQAVHELFGETEGERRILYLISDFRTRQWNEPADMKKLLGRWEAAGAEIRLVDCVDSARPNLAVASLAAEGDIRAAGVGWFLEVAVTNYGSTQARNVAVLLEEDGRGRPSAHFAEIPPRRTARQRFQVNFPAPGWHQITARLEGDAVAADNQRYYAVHLPADLPILLIDGDPRAPDAKFLNLLLTSGGMARTGLRPTVETPQFLGRKPLAEYAAVNLANLDRLDATAVEALEKYVREGGGAVFFLGEPCTGQFFNRQLYRGGRGLFPLPLKGPAELPVDRLEIAPDVQTEDHFLFRVFAGKRNSFLQTLKVQRYFAAADGWKLPADGSVRVLARLRNGAPLVVEKSFGKGKTVAFLSSLAPQWNNWSRNLSVVVFLDLQAYLARGRSEEDPRRVGRPLELALDPAQYQPLVQFVVPQAVPAAARANTISTDAVTNAQGKLAAALADTQRSGFYEVRLTRIDGAREIRRYAYNVNPEEGNLAVLDQAALAERLQGLNYQYTPAAHFQTAESPARSDHLRDLILYFLILLLIGEQILAWSASYHPAAPRNLAAGGAR